MNKLNSVIFIDLDDTILQGPFEPIVFPTVFKELSLKTGLQVSKIRHLVVKENFSRQKDPKVSPILAMDWDDIIQKIASELNVQIAENVVLNLVETHTNPPFAKLLDNAYDVLQSLYDKNYCLIAATKGLSKYQMPLINSFGLKQFFKEIITPDLYGALKKDKSFYGHWPNITNTQIIVGDHFEDDVLYPKSFGFKSIWRLNEPSEDLSNIPPLNRPSKFKFSEEDKPKPDAIILNLTELPTVIDILLDCRGMT